MGKLNLANRISELEVSWHRFPSLLALIVLRRLAGRRSLVQHTPTLQGPFGVRVRTADYVERRCGPHPVRLYKQTTLMRSGLPVTR
jgi:hypothetical protein